MALYERTSGGHVAERVRPAPGSDDEARFKRLAADRVDGWRLVDDETPKATAEKPKAAKRSSTSSLSR